MLNWEEQKNIKFLVGQGHSKRRTADLPGHARNTVRSVIRSDGAMSVNQRNTVANPSSKISRTTCVHDTRQPV